MKFRKKHKSEGGEVFTDSLNDILFILLMFFLIVATLANPNVVRVGLPKGTKQYAIGSKKVPKEFFDSLLSQEIKKYRTLRDTPVVVINADTSSFYGEVFRVMRIAKKDSAKVVARIEQ